MKAFVALGSNLADPLDQLSRAKAQLAARYTVGAASSLYRSVPVGGPPGQPDYLNAVISLELPDSSEPLAFLQALQALERLQGRERRERWAARTLDLDVLDFGGQILELPRLELPHPRMMKRAFVLLPLLDVAPAWTHPSTAISALEALGLLKLEGVVRTALRW